MKEGPDRVLCIVQGARVRFHYPDVKTEGEKGTEGLKYDQVYQINNNKTA